MGVIVLITRRSRPVVRTITEFAVFLKNDYLQGVCARVCVCAKFQFFSFAITAY